MHTLLLALAQKPPSIEQGMIGVPHPAMVALVEGVLLMGIHSLLFFKQIRAKDPGTLKSGLLVFILSLFCVGYWAYVWYSV